MFGFGKKRDRLKKPQVRVAVLIANGVEQSELDASIKALHKAGARTFILAPQPGKIQAMHALKNGDKIPVDVTLDEVHPASFAALLIPGGAIAADRLRQNPRALEFARAFDRNGKPIAAMGHAVAALASAGLLAGRTLTSWPGIKDDVINAGGVWLDDPYVIDGNLLTGRASRDAAKFAKELVKHFSQQVEVYATDEA